MMVKDQNLLNKIILRIHTDTKIKQRDDDDDNDDDRFITDRQIDIRQIKKGKLFLMIENQLINIDRVIV